MGGGFGEREHSGREVERGVDHLVAGLEVLFVFGPAKATGDHEVNDEVEVVFEMKNDALADAEAMRITKALVDPWQ